MFSILLCRHYHSSCTHPMFPRTIDLDVFLLPFFHACFNVGILVVVFETETR